jgi:hypothetical protein
VLAAACLLAGCNTLASREAVVVCQAADTATTLHGLSLGAREANPFVAKLMEKFGKEGFVAAKDGVPLSSLHFVPVLSRDLVATLDGLTCGVAAHNALTARRLIREKEKSRQ